MGVIRYPLYRKGGIAKRVLANAFLGNTVVAKTYLGNTLLAKTYLGNALLAQTYLILATHCLPRPILATLSSRDRYQGGDYPWNGWFVTVAVGRRTRGTVLDTGYIENQVDISRT